PGWRPPGGARIVRRHASRRPVRAHRVREQRESLQPQDPEYRRRGDRGARRSGWDGGPGVRSSALHRARISRHRGEVQAPPVHRLRVQVVTLGEERALLSLPVPELTRRPVAFAISAASGTTCVGVKAFTTTSAPASASTRAMPLPIPRPAPVTIATFPVRSYS